MGLDDQSGLLKSTDVAPWSASSTISDSGSTSVVVSALSHDCSLISPDELAEV